MQHSLKRLKRPEPFYRAVQDSIKNYITENRLVAGAPLPPEHELARQLGVSCNSVREAAKALESVGILETRHGIGLFVRKFSFDPLLENLPYGLSNDMLQLGDLLQVRQILELGMIGRVIEFMPASQFETLEKLVETMRERAENKLTFPEEDREFHRQIYLSTNNQVLMKLVDGFWEAFYKASRENNLLNNDLMQTYLDHAAILQAIKERNITGASQALEKHYNALENRIQEAKEATQIGRNL